jgi:hypothetical protein
MQIGNHRVIPQFVVCSASSAVASMAGIDLSEDLVGEIFEPLRDEAFFAQVVFHPELHTLVWPNGADFAPEFLREKLLVAA